MLRIVAMKTCSESEYKVEGVVGNAIMAKWGDQGTATKAVSQYTWMYRTNLPALDATDMRSRIISQGGQEF